jgi:hypothetical protein
MIPCSATCARKPRLKPFFEVSAANARSASITASAEAKSLAGTEAAASIAAAAQAIQCQGFVGIIVLSSDEVSKGRGGSAGEGGGW